MKFSPLKLEGAWIIAPDRDKDCRGFFDHIFSARQFEQKGLKSFFTMSGISYSRLKGTFRGMHIQASPEGQAKFIRCIHGSIQDVLLDLRRNSPTFMQHVQVRLDAWSHRGIYVPEGIAHGFQTLTDDVRVEYSMTRDFNAELAYGVRWNDPKFDIRLPLDISNMNDRDRTYPDWKDK